MANLKFTTDKIVRRLRWVMICAYLFDSFTTLISQSKTYWHHPETVNEGSRLAHFFLSQGYKVYIFSELATLALVFLWVSTARRQLALVGVFWIILNHYFGASVWLVYHWHFGAVAASIYGIILGVILVWLAFEPPDKSIAEDDPQKPDNLI